MGIRARFCRYTSSVCYNCKSYDHLLWSCPEELREGFKIGKFKFFDLKKILEKNLIKI